MLTFNGVWEPFAIRDGLPDMRIECLFQDASGAIWIGTHARGVVACSDEGP
jgi:ligand-binding sensor domain-containing protein